MFGEPDGFVSCYTVRTRCFLKCTLRPSTLEYVDRDAFDVVDRAGRVLCSALKMFGMGARLPQLWGLKLRIEALPLPFFDRIVDKMMYIVSHLICVYRIQ